MTRTPDARSLSLEALHALRRRDAYAEHVLDGLFGRHPGLEARTRALSSHLVYGVLRWQNRLDAHLVRAAQRPLAKTHPLVLDILRLGAYQLLYLGRVPDRAAVSESVELAKRSGQAHAAPFVNAVLRKVAALGPELPVPETPAERLALQYGCPPWLVEQWLSSFGEPGAERLCRASSLIPTLTLRIDTRRLTREGAVEELAVQGPEAGLSAWSPEGVWVEGGGDPRTLGPVATAEAVVQDQASQLVSHLLAPKPHWRIVDACAAPGLKATHLAQLMNNRGDILALDLHPHRVRMIEELALRLRATSVHAEVADAALWSPRDGAVDAALVDAPCSGLGVLCRTPDAKWRRNPRDLGEFPPLQLSLLRNVAGHVRPGGVVVYATCTTAHSENEDVVGQFLRERPEFSVESPPAGAVRWEGLVTPEGYFRTFPGAVGEGREKALDGFFGARLVRRAS